jgi:hypothetical protein
VRFGSPTGTLRGINDFIDPPDVSGLCVFPDERRDLARDIARRILESRFLELRKGKFLNKKSEARKCLGVSL